MYTYRQPDKAGCLIFNHFLSCYESFFYLNLGVRLVILLTICRPYLGCFLKKKKNTKKYSVKSKNYA